VREVDLEVLIRIWYCNLLILHRATANAAVKVSTAWQDRYKAYVEQIYSQEA